jgi:hypothetical protein
MRLVDELVGLVTGTQHHRYAYVSASPENLDAVSNHVINHVDLDERTTLVYLTAPEGVRFLHGAFDGVFADDDVKLPPMSLKPDAFIKFVDHMTGSVL